MAKPQFYNSLYKVTSAGVTLSRGNFIGFMNQGATAQDVIITGSLIYNGLTAAGSTGVTFRCAAGEYINAEFSGIRPLGPTGLAGTALDIIAYGG